MIPLLSTLVIVTRILIVMQTALPPLKPEMRRNTSVWIPRTGTDFCLKLCLSLWYGFCHTLPVILVCLFALSCFSGRNFGQTCCYVIWLPTEHK